MKLFNGLIISLLCLSLWSNYRNFGEIRKMKVKTTDKTSKEKDNGEILLPKNVQKQLAEIHLDLKANKLKIESFMSQKGVSRAKNNNVNTGVITDVEKSIATMKEKIKEFDGKILALKELINKKELSKTIIISPSSTKTEVKKEDPFIKKAKVITPKIVKDVNKNCVKNYYKLYREQCSEKANLPFKDIRLKYNSKGLYCENRNNKKVVKQFSLKKEKIYKKCEI